MPRKAELLKSLARGRVRPSMNKYNIFNLYKKRQAKQMIAPLNSFRQQWYAKQETRAYHGEHIREGRWKTFFDPKLKGVAQLDASLSGAREIPTPLMMQTFAVLEKRLDFAVFRAMFASSVRQARQYILARDVKVNGTIITDPNYPLKPGDIFAVDPEKVLLALGRKKPNLREAINIDNIQIAKWNKYVTEAKDRPYETWLKKQEKQQKKRETQTTQYDQDYLKNDEFSEERLKAQNERIFQSMLAKQKHTTRATVFRDIISTGKELKKDVPVTKFVPQFGTVLSAKCTEVAQLLGEKNDIWNAKDLKEFEVLLSTKSEEAAEAKESKSFNWRKVKQLISEIHSDYQNKLRADAEKAQIDPGSVTAQYNAGWTKNLKKHLPVPSAEILEEKGEHTARVNLPWQKGLFGRNDPSKAYFTPWQPRPFLSTMAVLPHHIEISFETCHAIYLRDPVARPGASEVISPVNIDLHKRAYMWYLRHS